MNHTLKQILAHMAVLLCLMLPPYLFSSGWQAERAYFEFVGQPVWLQLTLYLCLTVFLFSASRNQFVIWCMQILETTAIAMMLYMAWIHPSTLLAMCYAIFALIWMIALLTDLLLSQNHSRVIMMTFSLTWIMSVTFAGVGLLVRLPLSLDWLLVVVKAGTIIGLLVTYLAVQVLMMIMHTIEFSQTISVSSATHDQNCGRGWFNWLVRPAMSIIQCRKDR
ncbi:hypothetical protein [Gynuella sunshinyii]|uniref:Uncharacterized protein n=1 Tax=Gynuella sunshinyii YC6258 TaxID=1445510 RepID=A0A0C5VDI5_9GAMM|nr:hypothetical protein [Gynuella sunshinyii]AJQ92602.1 hypothetical Protein YC6258_00552 [Gynuella sunshinyii YC6258]